MTPNQSDPLFCSTLFTPLADPMAAEVVDDEQKQLLMIPTNPCQQVRDSCFRWYEAHENVVRIHLDRCHSLVTEMKMHGGSLSTPPPRNNETDSGMTHVIRTDDGTDAPDLTLSTMNATGADGCDGSGVIVTWDEEGWHYSPPGEWPISIRRERLALYILALDAINFCFWPTPGYEYEQLATTLTHMAECDHEEQARNLTIMSHEYIFSASNLRDMTLKRMEELFRVAGGGAVVVQKGTVRSIPSPVLPPNLAQRCRLWNEIGRVLMAHFHGSAWNMIEQAQGSAVEAVRMLITHFPGFRDRVVIPAHYQPCCSSQEASDRHSSQTKLLSPLYFLKRAQICVGDWKAALHLDMWQKDEGQLTTFADYRIPQFLRQQGIMEYCPELATVVDNQQEIPATSIAELSIRAATVVVVEELTRKLKQGGLPLEDEPTWTAVAVDWYLWQVGEKLNAAGELKPHHRVQTTFY